MVLRRQPSGVVIGVFDRPRGAADAEPAACHLIFAVVADGQVGREKAVCAGRRADRAHQPPRQIVDKAGADAVDGVVCRRQPPLEVIAVGEHRRSIIVPFPDQSIDLINQL